MYEAIVLRTPVDTGRARGNWNVSVNTIDSSVNETKNQTFLWFRKARLLFLKKGKVFI